MVNFASMSTNVKLTMLVPSTLLAVTLLDHTSVLVTTVMTVTDTTALMLTSAILLHATNTDLAIIQSVHLNVLATKVTPEMVSLVKMLTNVLLKLTLVTSTQLVSTQKAPTAVPATMDTMAMATCALM